MDMAPRPNPNPEAAMSASHAPRNSHGPARLAAEQLIIAVGDLATWSIPAAHAADATVDASGDVTMRGFLVAYFDQLQDIHATYISARNAPAVVHRVRKFTTDSGYHVAGCTCGTSSEPFTWESNLNTWIAEHGGTEMVYDY